MDASVFFAWLRKTGGYKTIAFPAGGNVSVVNAVADWIRGRGGEVRTNWRVTEIETADGVAVAVHATGPDGTSHRIPCKAVISNVGPVFTAKLLENSPFAPQFAERVEGVDFTSIIAMAIASDKELLPTTPGFLNMADTERLCSFVNLTFTCPELAPKGKKLYTAYAVPRPSIGGNFDEQYELDLMKKDLFEKIEGFDQAEVIYTEVYRTAEWPAFRCLPGTDPGGETPVPNVYDTGDGAKLPHAGTGTSGCALSAFDVTDKLLRSGFLTAK
jgi:phytoene desaturase